MPNEELEDEIDAENIDEEEDLEDPRITDEDNQYKNRI